jgi:hypothetical protein
MRCGLAGLCAKQVEVATPPHTATGCARHVRQPSTSVRRQGEPLWCPCRMTSAHRCGGRWSRPGVLFGTTGVGEFLAGELWRRSIYYREEKGVMET